MSTAPILGIDFGTTNTAACWFDRTGKLRLVPVTERSHVLPSVAWYHAPDKALVGHAARKQIIDDPRHTIFGAKRFMGRRYQSEFVARHRDRFAFDIVEGSDGYAAFHVYGAVRPLTEVAYEILKQLVVLANHAAGEPFRECVLTVPAHATIRQREAIRYAAERAGLQVRAIVNEPTAAALYYANLKQPEQTVLVFDLGGGTFDATLLNVQNRIVKVLATGGDAFLGGANFDECIVENLVERFQQQHGLDLRESKVVMQRLVFAAESAKIALSRDEQTHIRVPCIAQKHGQFVDFEFTVTRAQFEEWTFRLVERIASAVEDVLERAGMKAEQVDELVLVGGQSRMPAIRRRFSHFRRFTTDKQVHPELGVAIGAAILGRNMARGITALSDVVPTAIGIMAPGAGSVEVVPANTPVPCTRSIALTNLPPGDAPVPVAIFEALDRTSVERELLGTLQVGAEWRIASSAAPTLEIQVGQDFVISAALVSSLARKPVTIVDARPQARS